MFFLSKNIYIYTNIYCTLLYLFSAESISNIWTICSLRWSIQDHLPPSHQKVLVRKAAEFFFREFFGQNLVVFFNSQSSEVFWYLFFEKIFFSKVEGESF